MNYQIKATQSITKYISIEDISESDAIEKAQAMVEDGDIRFDDEPYLHLDIQFEVLKSSNI